MSELTRVLSGAALELSVEQIEGDLRLARYQYERPAVRDEDVEAWNKWPQFVHSFYIWALEHGRLPSQDEHAGLYFGLYPFLGEGPYREGLAARIRRAWPSLVRDVHLCALLREAGLTVSYSLEWDVRAGIDISVWPPVDGRPPLFIHAYVSTRRARRFRERKQYGLRHFDLPLKQAEAQTINGVWLYQAPLHTDRVRAAL